VNDPTSRVAGQVLLGGYSIVSASLHELCLFIIVVDDVGRLCRGPINCVSVSGMNAHCVVEVFAITSSLGDSVRTLIMCA
jgi:hypothetical protein